MPIDSAIPILDLSTEAFDEIDHLVMKCAYESQNAFGRLCDERVYENDIAARLRALGVSDVHTQVAVRARCAGFSKEYRLDLVVNGAVYELKTVAAFTPRHDVQVYHYAMLLGIRYLKLLNLRSAKVTGLLRYNAVPRADRFDPKWTLKEWKPITPACEILVKDLQILIADWGTHLDSHLYEEALVQLNGGDAHCRRRVPVIRDGIVLGSHELLVHQPGHCFIVTALAAPDSHRSHLERLRRFTGQEAIQWINLSKRTLTLTTLH